MISVKHDSGNRQVFVNINNLGNATRRGLRQGFFQVGHSLKVTANKQILKHPKSGRIYRIRRGKTTRRHRASAPGESPANLSGAYRKTIGFKIRGSSQLIFGAGGAAVPYAKWLENGTRRMKPRPGLGNAVRATERNVGKYLASNIEKFAKK